MCEKWYKYNDKCPGCGTPFRRKDSPVYLACEKCGIMVNAPSYREPDKPTSFLTFSVGGSGYQKMTIAHFAKIQRLVVEKVERLLAVA